LSFQITITLSRLALCALPAVALSQGFKGEKTMTNSATKAAAYDRDLRRALLLAGAALIAGATWASSVFAQTPYHSDSWHLDLRQLEIP
jgi:microcin C transport system substrate-binding protein